MSDLSDAIVARYNTGVAHKRGSTARKAYRRELSAIWWAIYRLSPERSDVLRNLNALIVSM